MTGKIDHECEIEGCDLPWSHYLYTPAIIEVCKKHAYELIIKRTEILKEHGIDECDFMVFERREVENW